ncbi:MAG: flavodoxin family protein [Desulfosarcina sp.]|nr:flavodoxin family protein [Desulfobacterales bacterium]
MKVLIAYSSQTGNTRKLAETVYDCLPGEKELVSIDAAPEPEGYDLVAVGFWLQAGKPDPKATGYLARIKNTPLFLFATHGAASDSAHARNAMDVAGALATNARILGTFNCQGEVNPKVLEKVQAKNHPPPWIQDAGGAKGHPDEGDLEKLRTAIRSLKLE